MINFELNAEDILISDLRKNGIPDWRSLCHRIRQLPYGRNGNRENLRLVWKEQKGTCSSKHAFLSHIASLHRQDHIRLILVIYRMNEVNTPGIGKILIQNQLNYIPEAHCLLQEGEAFSDYTFVDSDYRRLASDIIYKEEILPSQVARYKVDLHRNFLKKWITVKKHPIDIKTLWAIREHCIQTLSHT